MDKGEEWVENMGLEGNLPELLLFFKSEKKLSTEFGEHFRSYEESLMSLGEITESVVGFTKREIEKLTPKVKNLKELKKLVKARKRVFVYFGQKNEHFLIFQQMAKEDVNSPFFISTEPKSKRKIFKHYYIPSQLDECVVLFRSSSLINEFEQSLYDVLKLKEITSSFEWQQFYYLEKFPKLRGEAYISFHRKLLLNKPFLALLIVKKMEDKEGWLAAKEAVKALPKGLLYTHSFLTEDLKLNFEDLLEEKAMKIQSNSIYLIYQDSNQTHVEKMPSEISKETVYHFVISFLS